MSLPSCPDQEQLLGYLHGLLAPEAAEQVDRHLETCLACQSTLKELELRPDPLRERAGPSPSGELYTGKPACRPTIEHLRRQVPPSTTTEHHANVLTREQAVLPRLRNYQLLEKLGQGGMGTVYLARHTDLDRLVAIKVLAPQRLGDAGAVARFKREMKAVGRLEHPNIVRAMDAGEEEGVHFLVMEYVPGCDVHRLVEQVGPLPAADACEIIRQAALGLQHAHEHQMVHRDVKPSNLILTQGPDRRPVVKVLDLGLALLRDLPAATVSEMTGEGVFMGTLQYTAPEQLNDAHNVDIRADVYSLGATLYKLLSGQAPFAGPVSRGALKQALTVLQEEVPAIQEQRARVSAEPLPEVLASLVHRLLAKDPSQRPATPAEVARDLEPFCMGTDLARLDPRVTVEIPVPAQAPLVCEQAPAETAPTTASPRRDIKRRWLVAVAALVLLLPLTYFFGGTVIRCATNQGQVVIEVDDPSVEVTVKEGEAVLLDRTGGRIITLAAGKHELEVRLKDANGEVRFFTKQLTLSRGGKEIVNVQQELARAKPIDRQREEPGQKAAAAPPAAVNADRRAAEWVLSIGGWVTIRTKDLEQEIVLPKDIGDRDRVQEWVAWGNRAQNIANVKDLPAGPFQVLKVNLDKNPKVTDTGLANLKGLVNLLRLDLNNANGQLTDACLVHFKELTNLREIYLDGARVTDAGLVNVKRSHQARCASFG
jgi:serine/threonine protein kinase